MKTILSVLCMLLSTSMLSQNYPITSITISLPANPDANIANWKSGTSMLTISANAKAVNGRPDVRIEDSKILVIIKKSGNKVCGTFTNNSAPAANFTTINKVWSGNNAVSLIGQECSLPTGEYELTVQLFGNGPRGLEPISEEKIKSFSIRGNESQNYQPPQLISPVNETKLNDNEIKKPITFRWTPVIPKPREDVNYKLRVWQMMEGQNSIAATIIQPPILTNDVGNITQVIVRLQTPPPNENKEVYVWNVQALNRDGKPIGENNGTSEAFTITVQPVNDAPVAIKLVSPANSETLKNQTTTFNWTIFPTPGDYDGDGYFKIKIVEIKGDESPEQAFKGNKPFFEKDSLRALSFDYPSNAPKLKPGKNYAWQVQAYNSRRKSDDGNATSEVWKFMMGGYGIEVSELKVGCAKDSVYNFSIKLTNPNNATAIFDKLELVMVNGAMITPINITTPTPAIGTLISANGTINITASFSYNAAVSNVCIKGYIKDQARPLLNSANSYVCDTLPCCDPCSFNKVEVVNNTVTTSGNSKIKLTNTITAGTSSITKIQADLVCVKIKPNTNACNQCNKKQEQQNHFTGSNIIINGSNWKMNGAGAASHSSTNDITRSLKFTSLSPGGVNISSGIKINHTIGLPPVSCCGDEIEIWIRYTVWNKDCYVCDKLVKASITRNKICGDGEIDVDIDK